MSKSTKRELNPRKWHAHQLPKLGAGKSLSKGRQFATVAFFCTRAWRHISTRCENRRQNGNLGSNLVRLGANIQIWHATQLDPLLMRTSICNRHVLLRWSGCANWTSKWPNGSDLTSNLDGPRANMQFRGPMLTFSSKNSQFWPNFRKSGYSSKNMATFGAHVRKKSSSRFPE